MRILQIMALVSVALSACTAPGGPRLAPSSLADPAAVDQAFAAAVAQRYAPQQSLADVRADLRRRGFVCKTVAPVEARLPYLTAICRKTVAKSPGEGVFTIRLETADGATLARAIGGFRAPSADDDAWDASDQMRRPSARWPDQA